MGPAQRVEPTSLWSSFNRRLQGCLRGSLRLSRYWGLTRQSLPPWCLESPCRPLVCPFSNPRAARKAVSRILAPCRTTPIDFLAHCTSSTRISGEIERRATLRTAYGRDETSRRARARRDGPKRSSREEEFVVEESRSQQSPAASRNDPLVLLPVARYRTIPERMKER